MSRCRTCRQPTEGPVAGPHWPPCPTCSRPHVPLLSDPQWAMLSAADKGPVDVHGRNVRRTANVLAGLGLGRLAWPGPQLAITSMGRLRLDLGRDVSSLAEARA